MQKRILSVQDISCFGKCSTTAALPILSALGHECVVLPTALLSTHTGGFEHYTFLDLTEEMKKILAHWQELKIRFDAVQTGYFAAPAQMALLQDFLEGRELFRFIDPVLGDEGALYCIYDHGIVDAMRALCRGADVITPNVTEAALLTGIPYDGDHYDPAAMDRLLEALFDLEAKRVVVTGVRFSREEIGIVAADRETRESMATPYADTFLPGAGDTFASALCGKLVGGVPFFRAAGEALKFTYRSVLETIPTPIRYGLCFEPILKTL